MATEAGLSSTAMGDFQRWYNQYIATKGRRPPRYLIENFLNANLSAGYQAAEQSRRTSTMEDLQQQQIDVAKKTARWNRQYQKEMLERQADAAEAAGMLGVAQLAVTGLPYAIKGIDYLGTSLSGSEDWFTDLLGYGADAAGWVFDLFGGGGGGGSPADYVLDTGGLDLFGSPW